MNFPHLSIFPLGTLHNNPVILAFWRQFPICLRHFHVSRELSSLPHFQLSPLYNKSIILTFHGPFSIIKFSILQLSYPLSVTGIPVFLSMYPPFGHSVPRSCTFTTQCYDTSTACTISGVFTFLPNFPFLHSSSFQFSVCSLPPRRSSSSSPVSPRLRRPWPPAASVIRLFFKVTMSPVLCRTLTRLSLIHI